MPDTNDITATPSSTAVVDGTTIIMDPPKPGDLIWFNCGVYSHVGAFSDQWGEDGLPKIFHYSRKFGILREDDFKVAAKQLQVGIVPLDRKWRRAGSSTRMTALLRGLRRVHRGQLFIPIPAWGVCLLCGDGEIKDWTVERTNLPAAERAAAIERARAQMGGGGKYNLNSNNCEHVIREIFTGKRESKQVQGAIRGGLLGSAASIVARIALKANPYTAPLAIILTIASIFGGIRKSKLLNTEKLPLPSKKKE